MQKGIVLLLISFALIYSPSTASSWEKLYSMQSTDCFRNVKEAHNGDFVLAGYTADFTSHDTDGIVIRMDDMGDTIWTFTYNGPNSKEDCFYKVLPTADGGFMLCGYSRSFNGSDNALFVKLNSSGHQQWVKNWGGSGIERAQDIVELPGGDFVACGYSTSSPAHYYDAFILKFDDNGSTQWSNVYGWSNYDDANSLRLLPDGGFILGGQSNNDLFLIRTDDHGDSLWTKVFGTSGTDNIECINFAQSGDGYIIAGHTDGPGNGGDNGYLVRTDTAGNEIWSKTFGGNDNDDFHQVEPTSDGGYVACGTSASGPWQNPNIWIMKVDSGGSQDWQKYFGGDNHDHGYSGMQTSDGGYVVVGHSHSFASNNYNEDALIVKMNSSGNVSNTLGYTTVSDFISPVSGGCGNANAQVIVEVTNYGESSVSSIPVTIEITGALTQTITQTYSSSVSRDATKTVTFSTNIDMSAGGTYHFHCYTGNPHDVIPERNYFDKTIVVNNTSSPPTASDVARCGPGSVTLSATSPDQVKWYAAATGGNSLYTGYNFNTPYLSGATTYYCQAGNTCPSARVPVDVTINAGLTPPVSSDASRCGEGIVSLSATSANTVKWYDTPTSLTVINTGANFTTPYLLNSSTYYVASENANCTSTRTTVHVEINPVPSDPVTADVERCGEGSVLVAANGSNSIRWYESDTTSGILSVGDTLMTNQLQTSTVFYAENFDGTCPSSRVPANVIINALPLVDLGNDTMLVAAGSVDLDAGAGFDAYAWSTSESTQLITVTTGGLYCVTVTDSNQCTNEDCAFVELSVGINSAEHNLFSVWPNPSAGIIHIRNNSGNDMHIKVFSIDGRSIYDCKNVPAPCEMDLSSFPKGIYTLQVTGMESVFAKRIVLE